MFKLMHWTYVLLLLKNVISVINIIVIIKKELFIINFEKVIIVVARKQSP